MSNATTIEAPSGVGASHGARRFAIECYDGEDLAAVGWPTVAAEPTLSMHVYQSREFLSVWMATIGKARRAQCVLFVVKDADKIPVLYLPLCVETRLGTRFLRFMDAGVADFNGPIQVADRHLDRGEFLDVWQQILSRLPRIDVVDLRKMPGRIGGMVNPLTHLACRPHGSSGHAIDLARWREVVATTSSIARMKKKIQRRYRKLGEVGTAAFLFNPSGPQWDHVMDRMFELKRVKYQDTSVPDFLSAPGVHDFYREIAAPERLGSVSHLSALTCGGRVVSAHLGFVARGRFYYVFPAFDTEYRSFAVGQVLLERLVESCVDDGFATFDLGEGDASYKQDWAPQSQPLLSHERGLTTVGRMYARLRHARRALRASGLYEKYLKSGARIAAPHANELAQ
jgi:CelD/BcsL family acetyltransferase involved in cellulose biosynthesis